MRAESIGVATEAATTLQGRYREAEMRIKYMTDEMRVAAGCENLAVLLNALKALIAAAIREVFGQ